MFATKGVELVPSLHAIARRAVTRLPPLQVCTKVELELGGLMCLTIAGLGLRFDWRIDCGDVVQWVAKSGFVV